jgi:superfamily I DNA/RNA helicase
MTIGTFHSICLQMLGQNGKAARAVIDEYDALAIVAGILKSLNTKNSPREVLKGISLIKSGALPSGEKTAIPPVYDLYCTQLERYGVLDYDDILLEMLRMLEDRNTGSMENKIHGDSFDYLLVDEFQDINATQYRLITEWGQNSAGIFVIGDPDQSIYGFRGSDARCFQRLIKDFPQARQFRLTVNYRSTPEIIRCAQSVISKQDDGGGSGRSLDTSRESRAKVRLLEANNEFSEALLVAKEINRMVGGIDMLDAQRSSVPIQKRSISGQVRGFSDIAVLYRTNHQARVLEQCLLKEGIPYVVAGRDEFLANQEVRKAVAFFRFVLNHADIVSLGLCLRTLDVCQADLLPVILEDYTASEKNVASLSGVMTRHLATATGDNSPKFLELLRKYEPLVRRENPQKLIESWIKDNGLEDSQSMELLLNMAVLHEGIPSFLNSLLLGRESDVMRSSGKSYSPDAVSLMTLHGAKGLEFPVVFLCGIKDGLIPLKNRNDVGNSDEERRLFYVGMTRAQDELILLTSGVPSPFLADIPEESLSAGKAWAYRKAPDVEQLSLFDT